MSGYTKDMNDSHTEAVPFHEPDLIPESSLSALEREQRRHAQDHILDMLEEEERLQLERDQEEEKERRMEDIRKRKEAAKTEVERLRAAKEMQKKMGKALLKNLAEAREKEERERRELIEKDSSKPELLQFANPSSPDELSATGESRITGSPIDWGDISPARLRSVDRVPLRNRADTERHPMKMHVVERHPTSYTPESEPQPEGDSDDEPLSTTSSAPNEDGNMLHESHTSGSDDDDDDDESDEGLLEEEYDWNSAQHHREVALAYYKKRHAIGVDAAQAMTSHTHDDEEWNEGCIPPDQRPKPSVSRFRADRMATAYDRSTSTSLEPSVIPASRQKSLQEAIRLGKVENDHLVGGEEGESGSEDEAVREILELLSNGGIHNAGPNVARQNSEGPVLSTPAPSEEPATVPSVPAAPKTSKFKMARNTLTSDQPSKSPAPLPLSRKVVEPPASVPPIPSKVVESPSFPSVIVDSPSFPRRKQLSSDPDTSRPQRPPVVMRSTVTEGSARSAADTVAKVPEGRISRFKAERM
ncbi:uncharacterized protein EDB91DRAFT_1325467 [Suillus paluster]|uniref:uncharacterized protein n=1 Tax=Suillus paluster TaxID=48578 RepID=UPI001B8863AA|nr:uncharacterized protein EDB91DRAFT_1325467 [Suillus paluster]KAG1756414.1 hypothetical protein EDB91DRAFT_1325467 [Suillus paluster]